MKLSKTLFPMLPCLLLACVSDEGDVGVNDDNYTTETQSCPAELTCKDAIGSVNVLAFANRVTAGAFPFRAELPVPEDYAWLATGEMTGFCDIAIRPDPEAGTDRRLLFCTNAVRIPGDHASTLTRDILSGDFAQMVFGGGEAYYERGFVGGDASCKGVRQVFDFYPETVVGDVPAAKLAIAMAEPRVHDAQHVEIPARLLPPPEALQDHNPGDSCGVIEETGDVHGDMRLFVGTDGASTLFVMNWEGMAVEPLGASKAQSWFPTADELRSLFMKWMVGEGHNGAMQFGMTRMTGRYAPAAAAPSFVDICAATAARGWNWADGAGSQACQ